MISNKLLELKGNPQQVFKSPLDRREDVSPVDRVQPQSAALYSKALMSLVTFSEMPDAFITVCAHRTESSAAQWH